MEGEQKKYVSTEVEEVFPKIGLKASYARPTVTSGKRQGVNPVRPTRALRDYLQNTPLYNDGCCLGTPSFHLNTKLSSGLDSSFLTSCPSSPRLHRKGLDSLLGSPKSLQH
jgi:hypothetical protein